MECCSGLYRNEENCSIRERPPRAIKLQQRARSDRSSQLVRYSVRRENGQHVAVPRDRAASLDYSYAVTGHTAQGLDADCVLIHKATPSLTTNRRSFYTDSFYTNITRAREAAIVMTDSALPNYAISTAHLDAAP